MLPKSDAWAVLRKVTIKGLACDLLGKSVIVYCILVVNIYQNRTNPIQPIDHDPHDTRHDVMFYL